MKTIYVLAGMFITILIVAIVFGIAYIPFLGKNPKIEYFDVFYVCMIVLLVTTNLFNPLTEGYKKNSPYKTHKDEKSSS